jgi:hypothetical protein
MATTGLPLKKMIKNTPYNIIDKSSEKNILKVEKTLSKKGRTAVRAQVIREPKKNDKNKALKHDCWVIGLENDGPVSSQKCMVSCDCENFKFQWEYALTHYGASKIKYSNGMPSHITNPNLVPGVCSHLYGLLETIIAKGM